MGVRPAGTGPSRRGRGRRRCGRRAMSSPGGETTPAIHGARCLGEERERGLRLRTRRRSHRPRANRNEKCRRPHLETHLRRKLLALGPARCGGPRSCLSHGGADVRVPRVAAAAAARRPLPRHGGAALEFCRPPRPPRPNWTSSTSSALAVRRRRLRAAAAAAKLVDWPPAWRGRSRCAPRCVRYATPPARAAAHTARGVRSAPTAPRRCARRSARAASSWRAHAPTRRAARRRRSARRGSEWAARWCSARVRSCRLALPPRVSAARAYDARARRRLCESCAPSPAHTPPTSPPSRAVPRRARSRPPPPPRSPPPRHPAAARPTMTTRRRRAARRSTARFSSCAYIGARDA